jgi:hypothetical protein
MKTFSETSLRDFRRRTMKGNKQMKTITKTSHCTAAAVFLAALALATFGPSSTRADTVALSFTGGFNENFFSTISGWGFSLSSPVVLTDLGVFDLGDEGLITSHVVTIWTSTGTQLVQATVPDGTSATLVDSFRYVAVPPTLLPAGDYIIGASYPYNNGSNNGDRIIFHAAATTASGVTYNGTYFGFWDSVSPPQVPQPDGTLNDGFFGPNFQFTTPPQYVAQVQPPINADGTSIFTVRRGVVPVKFTLTQGGVATCDLPSGTIAVSRTSGGVIGSVNESTYAGSADSGSNFRISNCQYVYNLNSGPLGVGIYRVDIKINNQVVGNATFELR